MLQYMTKQTFKEAVDEYRFVVQSKTPTKWEVFYISYDTHNNIKRHGLLRVINPNTKDGLFRQTGGNYSKAHACIADIASYVDANDTMEVDSAFSCVEYLQAHQKWNVI